MSWSCRVVHFHEIGGLGRAEVVVLELLWDRETFPQLLEFLILLTLSCKVHPIYAVALELIGHFPMSLCMQPARSE